MNLYLYESLSCMSLRLLRFYKEVIPSLYYQTITILIDKSRLIKTNNFWINNKKQGNIVEHLIWIIVQQIITLIWDTFFRSQQIKSIYMGRSQGNKTMIIWNHPCYHW